MVDFTNSFTRVYFIIRYFSINIAVGGNLMNKNAIDAFNLIEEMTLNQHQWSSGRGSNGAPGRYKTNAVMILTTKVAAMQKRFEQMNVFAVSQSSPYIICGDMDHLSINCNLRMSGEGDFEQVNALNNNLGLKTTLIQTLITRVGGTIRIFHGEMTKVQET